jgi:hypothetical protein
VDGWVGVSRTEHFLHSLEDYSLDLDSIDNYEVTYYRGDPKIAAIVHHWDDLVDNYTDKTPTFPLDRILAISALASEFGRVLDDVYLAGIWHCTFPTCLFWTM